MAESIEVASFVSSRLSRRRWLLTAATAAGAMIAACAPAPATTPTSAPSKPSEPAKPAAPAAPTGPSPSPSASPAAAAPAANSVTAAPFKAKEMTSVSQMMNWFAQSAHGGLFAALKNGDYERANLKMTNEQGGPQTPVVPQIGAGKIQFGMMQADQIFLAREEGIPLVGVFTVFQTNPQGLLYHMENPVRSFEDLNGRKVHVAATAAFWQYFVKKYKLDNVQQFNYNGQLAIWLADKEAVFQCYVTTEPLTAKKQGANPGYLLNADSGFNPYANIMATTEQMIKEKPDVVQAYVSASLLGWRSYLQNPEPTLAFIKEYAKDYDLVLGAETAKLEQEFVLGKAKDPKSLGAISDERMKTLYDQLRDVGMLKKEQDYKQAFNASFIEAAQKA